jgi:hypothetical protein
MNKSLVRKDFRKEAGVVHAVLHLPSEEGKKGAFYFFVKGDRAKTRMTPFLAPNWCLDRPPACRRPSASADGLKGIESVR